MTRARSLLKRLVVVALGLSALGAGMAVGSAGCDPDCVCSGEPALGRFVVHDSPERPELVGAEVEATAETIEIRYALADTGEWRVVYRVTDPPPGE